MAAQSALRHQTKTWSEQGAARLPRWSQRGNKVSFLLLINCDFWCCLSRFYINVLLYQVSVLIKSSLGAIKGASCRVDSPYFCRTFSTAFRFWDSVAIFPFSFESFSSTFFKVISIFNSLNSFCCFHCSWITR